MRYFINLSAGLMQNDYVGEIVRIQSSHLESHSFDKLFYGLSDSLLFHLSNGEDCILVDCSSNSVGKVIKRFIPIAKTVIHKRFFGIDEPMLGVEYRERIFKSLSHETKRKIDYYKRFEPKYPIKLSGISIKVEKEITKRGGEKCVSSLV